MKTLSKPVSKVRGKKTLKAGVKVKQYEPSGIFLGARISKENYDKINDLARTDRRSVSQFLDILLDKALAVA